VLPAGAGKHPAAVYLHPGQGDRSTFLDEAVAMAQRGLVSLLIGGPFTRPENRGQRGGNPWEPVASRREQVQGIVDVRRGFDLLVSRPEVDPQRLAYVGHSYGATIGGTLAAVERRPVAHVLMAGLPSLTHASTHGHNVPAVAFQTLLTPEQQQAYVDALAPIDAVHYIGRAAPAKLLFQFARRDEFITPWDAAVYIQAASDPKEVRWYDTDHFFNDAARNDRMDWLARVLGL
jgi:dienelactone hydrolase